MNTQEYWEEAALLREREANAAAEDAAKKIRELYEQAQKDIADEIKKIKTNYMVRFGIDEETAEYYLSRELQKGNTDKLIEQLLNAKNDDERERILDFIHKDGLSTRAYASRIERFKAVSDDIALRLMQLAQVIKDVGEAVRREVYTDNYYRVIDDMANGLNVGIGFGMIDDAALDEVMQKPWHGKRFSERVWTNTERLASEAQEIVGRYIVTGRSTGYAVKELAEAFDVAEFRAETLIRTEIAHARSMSDIKAYEDVGIEKYRYMATLDERTCDVCGPLDGQTFFVRDIKEGVNYPVMHPRCRCTTVLDDTYARRAARNPITGKTVQLNRDITYEQWRENMTDTEKAAFEKAQRKYKNKAADKKRHEKYREILGKDVPRSLDKFQEIKYNNSEAYSFIKLDYSRQSRLVNNSDLALPNAKKATADDRKFTSYLFNPDNSKGWAKGKAFTSRLGYDIENYLELKQEILKRAEKYPARHKATDIYGDSYEQKMILYGKNGTPANVIVGWKSDSGKTWLTSAYIKEIEQ